MKVEIPRILSAMDRAFRRAEREIERDHGELMESIQKLDQASS
jgi:hypothetical protein